MSKYTDLAMERRSRMTPEGRPAWNCCQAVVSVFARDAGYDEDACMKAATYFRGGMQIGSVCGAITGSLLALGLAGVEDPDIPGELFRKIRENHNGMIRCRDLLRANAENGGEKLPHCNAMIRECIGYTEQILREKGKLAPAGDPADAAGGGETAEALLDKPCWVIDILPERVPEDSAGQFFAVEKYYLQPPMPAETRRRFTQVLLKLNCYSGFRVWFPDSEEEFLNPAPARLASWIGEEQKDLCILLEGEDVLITVYRDDTCMTVYNPSGAVLERIGRLAEAEGLFFRRAGEDA